MVTTNYIWDVTSDNVVMERDAMGATQAVYTQEPDTYGNLISQRRSGNTSYYHYDGNANTLALSNDSETVSDTYSYEAFGAEAAQSGSTENSYRFGGQSGYQYNESAADYYVRARAYQPKQGRWQSQDPREWQNTAAGQHFRNGATWDDTVNRFRYVQNQVLDRIDPSGLKLTFTACCEYNRDTFFRPTRVIKLFKERECSFNKSNPRNVYKCCEAQRPRRLISPWRTMGGWPGPCKGGEKPAPSNECLRAEMEWRKSKKKHPDSPDKWKVTCCVMCEVCFKEPTKVVEGLCKRYVCNVRLGD